MQALILAGGKGTRLRPYTTVLPKPLMPVGDYPILEIILRQLRRAGITEVILAVGHLGQLFEAFFQKGDRYGLKITYSFEEHALGTAGPMALVLDRLDSDFLVMNGDLLTTLDYGKLFDFHKDSGHAATMSLYRREIKVDFGVIESDENGMLARYIEKPVYPFEVSMGINIFNAKSVRPYLTPGQFLDIPELIMKLHEDGHGVGSYREDCQWLDIGRVDDYQRATDLFESKKGEFLPPSQ